MFDLIIIGGGIAGYTAAEVSVQNGFETLLIDKHNIGGAHIFRGSVPLNYLLENTHREKNLELNKDEDHPQFSLSYASVVKEKDENIIEQSKNLTNRLKAGHVTIVKGNAKIVGQSYHGYVVQCHNEDYTAKHLLIATGSVPYIPSIPGVKKATYSGFVLSSDNVLEINNIPKDLVVIGGGIIGLEIASYFNDLGCQVTIVEKRTKLAKIIDSSLSNAIVDSYKHQGINIILNACVVGIESQKVHYMQKGIKKHIDCERALLSIGRVPVDYDLGLETIGVKVKNGIITDEDGQTSAKNVYAAGDVTGKLMYNSRAEIEAKKCVLNMLGKTIQQNEFKIPVVLKTKPEIRFIGESEKSANTKNIPYKVMLLKERESMISGDKTINFEGFCKVIINQVNNKIIGLHIFGELSKARINEIEKLIDTVFDIDKISKA